MQTSAMLNQLGYTPNDTLVEQFHRIKQNTNGYDKIEKHIMDLNDSLKPIGGYVAMSNSNDFLKIKVEAANQALKEEAFEKIDHFAKKFKVELQKVDGKDTFYIIGFGKEL
ncbi:hypothetical protein [Sulfurimonas sp. HSL-1716]|uniref:hypothetical protein n=1 Tax=Hydrocurvibacter sulfurireducens TaxID=3131937 RepID=UPI0031F9389D